MEVEIGCRFEEMEVDDDDTPSHQESNKEIRGTPRLLPL